MGIIDRAKRAAKANLRSALGQLRRRDDSLEEAERELDEELGDAEFEVLERDEDLVRAYRRLELPYGAGTKRIEKAYRTLVARYHPDRFGRDPDRAKLAEAVTKILGEAKETLMEAWRKGRIQTKPRGK